jgi:hydrogenase nickel incorporation protein HypA/HybF
VTVHEYSLVQALVERVEQEARARRATGVHKLTVRIGEMAGVDVGLFTTAYETFRERTICERADLEVNVVPVQWVCGACSAPIAPGQPLVCASCGAAATLASGDEIVLDRVELEVS